MLKKLMRLTGNQRTIVKDTVAELLGDDSRIWLFGSRSDDTQRAGDIDLLIETDEAVPHRADLLCKLEARLSQRLGDQKFDIVSKMRECKTAKSPSPLVPKGYCFKYCISAGIRRRGPDCS